MKKVLTLTSVLALAACGQSLDINQHDADFAGCERIDTTKTHLVYKCPADMERFTKVKTMEPNAMFQEGGALDIAAISTDTTSVYVEVVSSKPNTYCKENFHYRTMVKPFNKETREWYAVGSCKTPVEVKAE